MRTKGVKLQITLSQELSALVDKEMERTHMTKSSFLSKLIAEYFNHKQGGVKKIIDLDIKK